MGLPAQHADAVNPLLHLCLEQAERPHAKTRALARELLNDRDTWWVVLDHPELPLTKNAAERGLRQSGITQLWREKLTPLDKTHIRGLGAHSVICR